MNSISTIKTEKPLSLEEIQENNVLSTRALARLDMVEISRKALGKYWEKRTSAEQKVFTDLLSLMFIKEAFPNSGKFFSSFKLIYGQTITNKSQATVPLKVIHEKEGEIYIDFHLYKNAVQWQVIDVDLDKISMRNNLRSQFYKVISTKNYQELVRRMEKKLASTNG